MFQGRKLHCRLKYISPRELQARINLKLPTSIFAFEFGEFREVQFHRIIRDIGDNYIKSRVNYSSIDFEEIHIPPSKAIRSWAEEVKRVCSDKHGIGIEQNSLFYVIHLRATDRYCVKKLYTAEMLVNKLHSDFGQLYTDNAIVYLMTDLPMHDEYVKVLKRSLGSNFCHAPDIPMFMKNPFKTDNYLIYAVEKSLATLADGFVDTYGSGKTKLR